MQIKLDSGIRKRIQQSPLFNGVTDAEFETLLAECTLKNYRTVEKMDYFKNPEEGLLLILEGLTEIYIENVEGQSTLLEMVQQGEVIGFSNLSHFLGEPSRPIDRHRLKLVVSKGSQCLQIPYSVVKKRLGDERVRDMVLQKMSHRLANVYASLGEQIRLADEWGTSEPYVYRVKDLMNTPPFTVIEEESSKEIAKMMVQKTISSVLVIDQNGQLVGIITEKDLVRRVVAQQVCGPLNAKDIMTKHLHTISPYDYYYEALSTFYNYGVKHLPVVEAGRPVGVVTLSNLMAKRDRGSMGILKKIEGASFETLPFVKTAIYDVLSTLIHDDISTIQTLEIITKLYNRLARQCVKLAVQSLERQGKGIPPVPYAWYLMGSGARGEQFMLTDQDHFLVYADCEGEAKDQALHYFSLLGEEIVRHLEQAGYARCKGQMMASEAMWRGSVSEWQQRIRTWALEMTNEQILVSYNFLSFRLLIGDSTVHQHFSTMVKRQLQHAQTFLYAMAQQELDNDAPPYSLSLLTLFKGRGKRQTIDIKKHALFPLHHCLQILAVHRNILNATPVQLLDSLVRVGELSSDFAEDIRHAYEIALRTRIRLSWKKHLRNEEIKTAIEFSEIRQWEQDELRSMLSTISSLQSHLSEKL
jgi:CBS domain-containing protein